MPKGWHQTPPPSVTYTRPHTLPWTSFPPSAGRSTHLISQPPPWIVLHFNRRQRRKVRPAVVSDSPQLSSRPRATSGEPSAPRTRTDDARPNDKCYGMGRIWRWVGREWKRGGEGVKISGRGKAVTAELEVAEK